MSRTDAQNGVDIIFKVNHYFHLTLFQVTKTITDDVMIPISNWRDKIGSDRHYVRSVTYGGYLIASLKYTAKKDETKEDIQASVEVNVNTKKVNVGIKGQFQSLAESANSVANLQISYTSSELPDNTPVDLDTILEEIKKFPEKVCLYGFSFLRRKFSKQRGKAYNQKPLTIRELAHLNRACVDCTC